MDAISKAVSIVNSGQEGLNAANAAVTDAQQALEGISNFKDTLPLEVDRELLERRIEAKKQKIQSEIDQLKLEAEERAIEFAKQKLEEFALGKLPEIPKLPVIDPKIIQTVLLFNREKLFETLKQITTRENLKKSREVFTYPITPLEPKLPETETVSSITEQIPTEINIPNLPFTQP